MSTTTTQPEPTRTMKQVDAARTLGVTERTLRTWTKERGWFTPVKRGGVLLYDAEQIRRFQTAGDPAGSVPPGPGTASTPAPERRRVTVAGGA